MSYNRLIRTNRGLPRGPWQQRRNAIGHSRGQNYAGIRTKRRRWREIFYMYFGRSRELIGTAIEYEKCITDWNNWYAERKRAMELRKRFFNPIENWFTVLPWRIFLFFFSFFFLEFSAQNNGERINSRFFLYAIRYRLAFSLISLRTILWRLTCDWFPIFTELFFYRKHWPACLAIRGLTKSHECYTRSLKHVRYQEILTEHCS